MPSKQTIPHYNHFNDSLSHLHLPLAPINKLYHIFKWNYTEGLPIHYPLSRQTYFDITFFISARFTHNLNTDAFSMINHSLHLITPGQVEQFETTTLQRAEGYGFYFMPEFLFSAEPQLNLEKDFPFLKNGNRNVLYLSPAQSVMLQQIFDNAIIESNLFNDDIVRHYLLILLYKIKTFEQMYSSHRKLTTAQNSLVIQFENLLKRHYIEYTKITDYATMLHVSSRTLSEAVQRETGKTPKQLLQEMILLEAKLLLLHSSMQIAAIAAKLNFHDAPHFTRYFNKAAGVTPQQFRKLQAV